MLSNVEIYSDRYNKILGWWIYNNPKHILCIVYAYVYTICTHGIPCAYGNHALNLRDRGHDDIKLQF